MIYIALLLGQIIFSLFTVFWITQPGQPFLNEGSNYPFLGLLVVFLAAGAAYYVNQLRLKSINLLQANLAGKTLHYRTSVLMRSAMVEAGNLCCLVLAILEHSLAPLLYFCMGLLVFLYFKPSLNEISSLYQLTQQEQNHIQRQLKSGR